MSEENKKDTDRLLQRLFSMQGLLQKLGLDDELDEEDIKREHERLPKDSDDYLDLNWGKAAVPVGEGHDSKFELGFEPFRANLEVVEWIEKEREGERMRALPVPLPDPELVQKKPDVDSPKRYLIKDRSEWGKYKGNQKVVPPSEGPGSW